MDIGNKIHAERKKRGCEGCYYDTVKKMNSLERCKELIKEEHSNWIGLSNQEAIKEIIEKLENSIPKSKIEEKIKFYKKAIANLDYDNLYNKNVHDTLQVVIFLQELLESEENK